MNSGQWVLVVTAAAAACCAGGVWLEQLSCYPLWRYLKTGDFASYYAFWSGTYRGFFFAPLAIVLAGAAWIMARRAAGVPVWCAATVLVLQLIALVLAATSFSPAWSRVLTPSGDLNEAAYARLLRMHWLSVAIVTFNTILLFIAVDKALLPSRPAESDTAQWLITVTAITALAGLWAVWLVQQVCYRLWPYVSKNDFKAYHTAWWHSIWTSLFIPAGLALAGWIALIWVRPPGVSGGLVWTGIGLEIAIYTLTAVWWGPLMARLATPEDGLLMPRYRLLMSTHWARVALITAFGVVAFVALVRVVATSTAAAGGPAHSVSQRR